MKISLRKFDNIDPYLSTKAAYIKDLVYNFIRDHLIHLHGRR